MNVQQTGHPFGIVLRLLAALCAVSGAVLGAIAFFTAQRNTFWGLEALFGFVPLLGGVGFGVALMLPYRGRVRTFLPMCMLCVAFIAELWGLRGELLMIVYHTLYVALGLGYIFTVTDTLPTPWIGRGAAILCLPALIILRQIVLPGGTLLAPAGSLLSLCSSLLLLLGPLLVLFCPKQAGE